MSQRKITRVELSAAIREVSGMSRSDASEFLEIFLDQISAFLILERRFLCSNFGTFSVQHKKRRMGRNPRTGQPAVVSARNVVSFKASNSLKRRVSKIKER